jgi:cell division protease FtsH
MAESKGKSRFNPRIGDRRGPRPLGPRAASSIWYGVAFLLLLGLAQAYYLSQGGQQLSYSEFKSLVKSGAVEEVTISEQTMHGTLKQPPSNDSKQSKEFTTTRVDDPKLVEDLETAHVQYKGEISNHWLRG